MDHLDAVRIFRFLFREVLNDRQGSRFGILEILIDFLLAEAPIESNITFTGFSLDQFFANGGVGLLISNFFREVLNDRQFCLFTIGDLDIFL